MPHSLVIGGTGMLRRVCLHLAQPGQIVSVVARGSEGLASLASEASVRGGRINPIHVDYRDTEILQSKIEAAAITYGPIELTVAWIHSSAPRATAVIAQTLESTSSRCRYFDILGSLATNPILGVGDRKRRFDQLDQVSYRRIILGFVIEGNRSRWLTDDEICSGIIEAIESDRAETIVGTVTPWERRP